MLRSERYKATPTVRCDWTKGLHLLPYTQSTDDVAVRPLFSSAFHIGWIRPLFPITENNETSNTDWPHLPTHLLRTKNG